MTTWAEFIRTHLDLLAGTDFFTAEVLTLRGLVTYYVLFFIHLESRRVAIAGITVQPNEAWMKQMARNATMDEHGALLGCRYLLHDRDTKFTRSFRAILASDSSKRWCCPRRAQTLMPTPSAGCGRLRRSACPCRAEPPGQGQRPAVPSRDGSPTRRTRAVSRAIGRPAALLPSTSGMRHGALPAAGDRPTRSRASPVLQGRHVDPQSSPHAPISLRGFPTFAQGG